MYDIHRQLNVGRAALSETSTEGGIKRVSERRVRVGANIIKQRLGAAERPAHIGESRE
jgi:hypothetical protein